MAKKTDNQIHFRLRPNSKKDQVIAKWKAEQEKMGENVSERARDLFYRAIVGESGQPVQLTVSVPVVTDEPGPVEQAREVSNDGATDPVKSLRNRYKR